MLGPGSSPGSSLGYEDLRYASRGGGCEAVQKGYNMSGVMGEYYVYILASGRNGTLYVGMTNNLAKRVGKHSRGKGSKFVRRYKLNSLVYYESVYGYLAAHKRERELKWWQRKWKLAMIEERNPDWKDLSKELAT